MKKATQEVVDELKKLSKPVKEQEEIEQVATISAGDKAIGEKIAQVIEKVGKDGVITVEEGRGLEIEVDYKEGMEFDQRLCFAYFVTNPETMEAEIDNPYILLTDKRFPMSRSFFLFGKIS